MSVLFIFSGIMLSANVFLWALISLAERYHRSLKKSFVAVPQTRLKSLLETSTTMMSGLSMMEQIRETRKKEEEKRKKSRQGTYAFR